MDPLDPRAQSRSHDPRPAPDRTIALVSRAAAQGTARWQASTSPWRAPQSSLLSSRRSARRRSISRVAFKTKPEIALEQMRWACEAGLPGNLVLVDAGYGHDSKLRTGITELGKRYVSGVH